MRCRWGVGRESESDGESALEIVGDDADDGRRSVVERRRCRGDDEWK